MNIQHGGTLIEDQEGEDLPHLDDVRQQAVRSAREIMSARVLRGQVPNGDKFVVVNEAGEIVLVMPFHDAIA